MDIKCKRCGECCKGHPYGIAPNEIYPITRFLGLEVKDMFEKYLSADYWVADCDEPLYIVPKRVGDKGFYKVSSRWNEDWDRPCIFLESNGLCKIHPVKPDDFLRLHSTLGQRTVEAIGIHLE